MMFSIFDIAVFTVIAVSTIMGLYKGLLGIAINLAGFVASIVAAIQSQTHQLLHTHFC